MNIKCPHCQHLYGLPDGYAGHPVDCPACGRQPNALTENPDIGHAFEPTTPDPHPVIEAPPEDGFVLVSIGWILIVISVVLALPLNGVSLAGILPGIFLVGLGKLVGHSAKTAWYLKKIYEQQHPNTPPFNKSGLNPNGVPME